jgi:hypothetical protein
MFQANGISVSDPDAGVAPDASNGIEGDHDDNVEDENAAVEPNGSVPHLSAPPPTQGESLSKLEAKRLEPTQTQDHNPGQQEIHVHPEQVAAHEEIS